MVHAGRTKVIAPAMTLHFMAGLEVVLKTDGSHACICIGGVVIGLGNLWIPIQIRSQIQLVSLLVHASNAERGWHRTFITNTRARRSPALSKL